MPLFHKASNFTTGFMRSDDLDFTDKIKWILVKKKGKWAKHCGESEAIESPVEYFLTFTKGFNRSHHHNFPTSRLAQLHTSLCMTPGASLEHCTPSDILGCNTLKRQENEFSSYLCKQFRKHIHQFLFSERFYFCGDFSRTKDSISKLYHGKGKKMKPPSHYFSNKQCCTSCYHW